MGRGGTGYQPELGGPWFIAFGRPIYLPWALFGWWFSFEAYAPTIFEEAGAIAATSGLVGCTAAIFGSLWRARQSNNLTTYGSARWANDQDIRLAGLLGVFLGRTGPRYLRHDGPEHIMAFAPTRSGKGVGLVVPTLLGWSGSAVIHDMEGENWQLTAGWRQRFSHCLLFNPTDARSARYNPLLEVRRGADEVRDVQNIADILVDPHDRVAFATNDERTAKRISDALGTATEQRAMRNYAGHRFAPWLAHAMVSRQESARVLLTPGEVMQLPATDELVLVATTPPIRATMLRYFEDGNFKARVLPRPTLSSGDYADRPPTRRRTIADGFGGPAKSGQ